MGLEFDYTEGQTPIDEAEKEGLKIRSISTMAELDQFEQQNIEEALLWLMRKSLKPTEVLRVDFMQQIHQRMFKQVWKWAGHFRQTNKNIGVPYYMIRQELQHLLEDGLYWIENETFPPAEIALRFKHRLVSIHLFPNGNGRHSRLMADILHQTSAPEQPFTWGRKTLRKGEARKKYIQALCTADQGDITPLIAFAQS